MSMMVQGSGAAVASAATARTVKQSRVVIDYTNWRGERSKRTIEPFSIRFGSTEWHKEDQWLLMAWTDKGRREFAMKDIHSWKEVK